MKRPSIRGKIVHILCCCVILTLSLMPAVAAEGTPGDLAEALQRDMVKARISGFGRCFGNSILVRVTNKTDDAVSLSIAPGTILLPDSSQYSRMVVRRVTGRLTAESKYIRTEKIALEAGETKRFIIAAYSLDFEKENPSRQTTFELGPVDKRAKAVLEQAMKARLSSRAIQAALWMKLSDIEPDQIPQRISISAAELSAADNLAIDSALTEQVSPASAISPKSLLAILYADQQIVPQQRISSFEGQTEITGSLLRLAWKTHREWMRYERRQRTKSAILGTIFGLATSAYAVRHTGEHDFLGRMAGEMTECFARFVVHQLMPLSSDKLRSFGRIARFAAMAVIAAPDEALALSNELEDVAERAAVLAVMLVMAAEESPESVEVVAAQFANTIDELDPVMRVELLTLVLPYLEEFAAPDSIVTRLAWRLRFGMLDEEVQDSDDILEKAACVYVRFAPRRAERWAGRLEREDAQVDVLLAGAESLLAQEDFNAGLSRQLIESAASLARGSRKDEDRARLLARVAGSKATGEAREPILKEAEKIVAQSRSTKKREKMQLEIAREMMSFDLSRAIELLPSSKKPLRDDELLLQCTLSALESEDLEQMLALGSAFSNTPQAALHRHAIGSVLAASSDERCQAEGHRLLKSAAQLAWRLDDSHSREIILKTSLPVVAIREIDFVRSQLRRMKKDNLLYATCVFRIARAIASAPRSRSVLATQSDTIPDPAKEASSFLREGLSCIDQLDKEDQWMAIEDNFVLALDAVAALSAESVAQMVTGIKSPLIQAEIQRWRGVSKSSLDPPASRAELLTSLETAGMVKDAELREMMASRVTASLGLVDFEEAYSRIQEIEKPEARAFGLSLLALLLRTCSPSRVQECLTGAANAISQIHNPLIRTRAAEEAFCAATTDSAPNSAIVKAGCLPSLESDEALGSQ